MCKWPKYALRTVNANQALGTRQPQPSLHHVGLSSCVIAKSAGTTVHMSSRSRVAQNRLKTDETANGTICISVCSCASKQKVMVTLVYCMRYSLVKMQVKLHARRQGSQYRPNTNREWYGENTVVQPPFCATLPLSHANMCFVFKKVQARQALRRRRLLSSSMPTQSHPAGLKCLK